MNEDRLLAIETLVVAILGRMHHEDSFRIVNDAKLSIERLEGSDFGPDRVERICDHIRRIAW